MTAMLRGTGYFGKVPAAGDFVRHATGDGPDPRTQDWFVDGWARYALAPQRCVPGSTFEMYRAALGLRREYRLGSGSLAWVDGLVDGGAGTLVAFVNREVLALTNIGEETVTLAGTDLEVLISSADLPHGQAGGTEVAVPPHVTVWVRRR